MVLRKLHIKSCIIYTIPHFIYLRNAAVGIYYLRDNFLMFHFFLQKFATISSFIIKKKKKKKHTNVTAHVYIWNIVHKYILYYNNIYIEGMI